MTTGPAGDPNRLEEIRAATRELNAAISDARAAKKDLEATVAQVSRTAATWRKTYEDSIRGEWERGLEEYHAVLGLAIREGVATIEARLDKVASMITRTYDTPVGRRTLEQALTGEPPPVLRQARPAVAPPPTRGRRKKR